MLIISMISAIIKCFDGGEDLDDIIILIENDNKVMIPMMRINVDGLSVSSVDKYG